MLQYRSKNSLNNKINGEGNAGGSVFYCGSNFGIMGSQSLVHLGVLSTRLSEGSLVLIAACSVRFNCLLYLVSPV